LPQGSSESHLPAELASSLAPHLKRALDNPIRRRILRALNKDGEPRTLGELSTLIPGTNISTIGYHVLTLEECGTVSVTVLLAESAFGRAGNRYASNIGDDQAVREVLSRTRQDDEPDD
jgi:DNA-binding transcriptional ArsR family regulator